MPKGLPTFIVEGHLEHEFFNRQCRDKVRVLKLNNGKDVTPAALAKQVLALVRSISKTPPFVIVIVDREKRLLSAIDLETEIAVELTALGLQTPFFVHVPDMMIENWILADPSAFPKDFPIDFSRGCEGFHGKGKIEAAFKSQGLKYKERFDGVNLLSNCVASKISRASTSFFRLFSTLQNLGVTCHWLSR
jgi:hypothetical protein